MRIEKIGCIERMHLYFKALIIFIGINSTCCNSKEPEILVKIISDGVITIKWFYYSYITTDSPEFAILEKEGIKKQLFKAKRKLVNIDLQGKKIVIKYINDEYMDGTEITSEKKIFDYQVVLDSTGTYSDLRPALRGTIE